MTTFARSAAVLATTLVALAASTPAHAQATRTWVAGGGDDANPCSRDLPCKTFAGAIARTATSGLISCIDRANFGAVTITKSIMIDCPGGVITQPASSNGITLNTPANATVMLRGLSLEGAGTGTVGVGVVAVGTLHMDDCSVSGFLNAMNASVPAGFTTNFAVRNSSFSDNRGGSITIFTSGSGIANGTFTNVKIDNNGAGFITSSSAPGSIRLTFWNSSVSGNQNEGMIIDGNGGGAVYAMVSGSTIAHNGRTGLFVSGPLAFVNVFASKFTANTTGLHSDGGATLGSFRNNKVTLDLMSDVDPETILAPLTPQ
jgi:hypothetical protein